MPDQMLESGQHLGPGVIWPAARLALCSLGIKVRLHPKEPGGRNIDTSRGVVKMRTYLQGLLGSLVMASGMCLVAGAWLGAVRSVAAEPAVAFSATEEAAPQAAAAAEESKKEEEENDLPRVVFKTSRGEILFELFEDEAPNTVANFITLVEAGFYDGLVFHRVLEDFMAQGGCPHGRGDGGPGYRISCECYKEGFRKHDQEGILAMAHAGKDTGGSQFYITFGPTPHLDGKHTVFGRVIEGMEAVHKLTRVDPGNPAKGVKPDKIEKAEVVRKRDHEYKVEKLPEGRRR